MNAAWILLAAGLYLYLLFAVAYWVDRRNGGERRGGLPQAWIYALSIAVYHTSWTFYGSVGRSAAIGYGFLAVYIGPAFIFIFAQPFLRKLLAVSKTHHITSIADLIAARYGKRQLLAGLATLIAVIGIVPYISLQLKAVSSTFDILRHAPESSAPHAIYADTAFYLMLVMTLFVSVFGTRRVDATEQHRGMVTAVALESLVKLAAFLAVGIFVTYGLFGGFGDLLGAASARPGLAPLLEWRWTLEQPAFWSTTLLSALVIFCLPRQFQVTVVENTDPVHLRHAAWIFPLYMGAINLFVVPIAMAGLLTIAEQGVNADTFVLTLPLAANQSLLALLVFLGGFSAATGMIIVETIALATMVSNDLALPLLLRGERLRAKEEASVVGLVKWVRRGSIAAILLLAYAYVRLIGESYALVSIGLVSFAAAAQFAPAIVGGLYWRRGHQYGALAGLLAGFVVWAYTLLLPSFAESGWIGREFVDRGVFGLSFLRPYGLFGLGELDRITHSLFWSLAANVGAYVLLSLRYRQSAAEAAQARAFVDVLAHPPAPPRIFDADVRWSDLATLLGRFLGLERATLAMAAYRAERGMLDEPLRPADPELITHIERLIAGAVGSSLARIVVAAEVQERQESVERVMHLLSDASQQIEVQWQRLREAVDNIDQGIVMFDAEQRLVVWNRRCLELLGLPEALGNVGTPRAEFRHACGETDNLDNTAAARSYERPGANGRIIEVYAKTLPRGGYLATYTDITTRKQAEESLREAKDALEQRVEERTRALKESETRFRDFAESASDWIWESDADHRFSAFSEGFEEKTGLSPKLLLGKRRWEIVSPDEPARDAGKWQRHRELLERHEAFRGFEYMARQADGSVRHFRIGGKPVFAADGRFLGYRGTGSDITVLQQAQNELLRSEKLAALGGLVAGVAHEINTPIGIGLTAASYLEEQTHELTRLHTAGQMKRADLDGYVKACGEACASLITNLRRAAGLVQGFKQVAVDQSSEQRRQFNLKGYLEEVLASLRPKLKKTQHTVHIDCPENLQLDSYPGAYSQIITNLVLNSLQHGFEEMPAGRIDIAASRSGRELLLSYRDNGKGMSAELARRLFEPFFTTKRGQGGSGLGMHVVYNLVTQTLGGRIEYLTAPGEGVSFSMRIPVPEGDEHEQPSTA